MKSKLFPELQKRFGSRALKIVSYDAFGDEEGVRRLNELEEDSGFLRQRTIPALYFAGNFLIGRDRIESSMAGLIQKELAGPDTLISVKTKPYNRHMVFGAAKKFFTDYKALVALLVILSVYLRVQGVALAEYLLLSFSYLIAAIAVLLFINACYVIFTRHIVVLAMFAPLFYLGLFKLHEYYSGSALNSRLIAAIQKKRSGGFLLFLTLFCGAFAGVLSAGRIAPLNILKPSAVAGLLLFSAVSCGAFIISQNKLLSGFVKVHRDLSRFLSAGLLFMLAVVVWLLK